MIRSRWACRVGIALAVTVGGAASAEAATTLWVDGGGDGTRRHSVYASLGGADSRLDIVRGGTAVASVASWSGAGLQVDLLTGDELVITDKQTSVVHRATLTDRPTLDPSVCGRDAFVAGSIDPGATVSLIASTNYGRYDSRPKYLSGSATTLPGDRFVGSFALPLGSSWSVLISQTRKMTADFTFVRQVSRKVGNCVSLPIVQDTTRPSASIAYPRALFASGPLWRALRRGTLTSTVTVNESSTVKQVLYLDNGATLPAATTAAKKRVVLGSGRTVVGKAGPVKLKVKLSKSARARVRRTRSLKIVLVTTVQDVAGNTTIVRKKLTAKRAKARR